MVAPVCLYDLPETILIFYGGYIAARMGERVAGNKQCWFEKHPDLRLYLKN